MKKVTVLLFVLMSISLSAFADDVRTIALGNIDGVSFMKVLTGVTYPETVVDPNDAVNWYTVRKYAATSGGVVLTCTKKFMFGQEAQTDCLLEFNLTKTTPELEVKEGKLWNAIVVSFNDANLASSINHGMIAGFYSTYEKVNVKLPAGGVQANPRVRIDCQVVPNSGGIAKSCTLVATPDQP